MSWALAGVALALTLALAGWRLGLFDRRGSTLSAFIGVGIVLFSDTTWFLLLLLFVILGTVATKFALNWKDSKGLSEGSDGSRTGRNVLANGGVPLLSAALVVTGLWSVGSLMAVYAGAIATATADTLSSEIGVLSGSTKLITAPWQGVEPGVDGGVSVLGQTLAVAGSLAIGAASSILFGGHYLLPVAVGGFLGCQVDSFLGATLERGGVLNNEGVNLLATASGGIVSLWLYAA